MTWAGFRPVLFNQADKLGFSGPNEMNKVEMMDASTALHQETEIVKWIVGRSRHVGLYSFAAVDEQCEDVCTRTDRLD